MRLPKRVNPGFVVVLVIALCCTPSTSVGADDTLGETEVKALGAVPTASIGQVALSHDGLHFAFVTRKGGNYAVVADGKEGPAWVSIGGLVVSSNGMHVIYAAHSNRGVAVVLNGKRGQWYRQVGDPAISHDEKLVAYCAMTNNGNRVFVLNEQVRGTYAADTKQTPMFTPDGKHFAYTASIVGKRNRPEESTSDLPLKAFVVRDDAQLTTCSGVKYPQFSPDGKSLAYAAAIGKKWGIIRNEKKVSDLFDDVGAPTFSPDGGKLAYPVAENGRWAVMVDKKLHKGSGPFMAIKHVTFSPDGSRVAYSGAGENDWYLLCEGKRGAPFQGITWIGWSPDGKHVACIVHRGAHMCMVLDGVTGPLHRAVAAPETATRVEGKLRYFVASGGEARLVEVDWPEDRDWTHGLNEETSAP